MNIYKIRRRSDGLFSSGGSSPRFTKVGKMWLKQHLMSHLRMLKDHDNWRNREKFNIEEGDSRTKHYYRDCDIVEYQVNEISSIDLLETVNETD